MKRIFVALFAIALAFVPMFWSIQAEAAPSGSSFNGFVDTDAINVRNGPSTSASVVDVLTQGTHVSVVGSVSGDFAAGTSTWYQLSNGNYVTSAYISDSANASSAAASSPGEHWVDVNLSNQTATAYAGDTPVRTILVTTGKPGDETPVGTWHIFSRVANETMIGTTPGDSYYQPDVLFTQYFAPDGVAIHDNYWRPDSVFGNIPTSHGCVGMRYGDAAFLWDFVGIGSRVVVHY